MVYVPISLAYQDIQDLTPLTLHFINFMLLCEDLLI